MRVEIPPQRKVRARIFHTSHEQTHGQISALIDCLAPIVRSAESLGLSPRVLCGPSKYFRSRLDSIDTRLDGMDTRLDGIDARFDQMDARFDEVDRRFVGVERSLDEINSRLGDNDLKQDEILNAIGEAHEHQGRAVRIQADKIDDHERRLTRLERHAA